METAPHIILLKASSHDEYGDRRRRYRRCCGPREEKYFPTGCDVSSEALVYSLRLTEMVHRSSETYGGRYVGCPCDDKKYRTPDA